MRKINHINPLCVTIRDLHSHLATYNKWDLNTFNVVRVFLHCFRPHPKKYCTHRRTPFSIWVRYTTSPTSHFWEDSQQTMHSKLRWGHSWKFFEKNSQVWNGRCRCVVFWSESGSILTHPPFSFGHSGGSREFEGFWCFYFLLIWMDFWDTPKFNEQIIEPFVSFWLSYFGWRTPQHNH